jgi:peptidoglycan/LPS O-acetylase OafA/YrhL
MGAGYLPNLNGLRAISVLVVLFGHATSLEWSFGGYATREWLWISGKFPVVMFFCLSGFLITHLAVGEISRTGNLDVRQFYVRRIARIWPLYFLIAIPALLLNLALRGTALYQHMRFGDYALILLILPGYADRPMFMGQTWSIAIEETFYMLYPLMIRIMPRWLLILALIAVVFSPEILAATSPLTCRITPCADLVRDYYWAPTFYGTIAIGCLTYFVHNLKNDRLNAVLFSNTVQCSSLVAIGIIITGAIISGKEQYFDFRWSAVAFSIVILNGAFNKASLLQIENRLMRFLGEISYGMYMLHVYCICLTLMVCWIFFKGETFPLQQPIVNGASALLTIVAAKLSFDYIENPIRRWIRAPKRQAQQRNKCGDENLNLLGVTRSSSSGRPTGPDPLAHAG